MKTEGTRAGPEENGSSAESNVVHFPRDWFGPTEELVPFGNGREAPATGGPGAEAGIELNGATAFWEGTDEFVEQPVEPSVDGVALPSAPRRGARRGLAAMAAVMCGALVCGAVAFSSLGEAPVRHHPQLTGSAQAGARPAARSLPKVTARAVRTPRHLRSATHAARRHAAPVRRAKPADVSAPATGTAAEASATGSTPAVSPAPYTEPSPPSYHHAASSSAAAAVDHSQSAGPTGAAAILGPGHCSC